MLFLMSDVYAPELRSAHIKSGPVRYPAMEIPPLRLLREKSPSDMGRIGDLDVEGRLFVSRDLG